MTSAPIWKEKAFGVPCTQMMVSRGKLLVHMMHPAGTMSQGCCAKGGGASAPIPGATSLMLLWAFHWVVQPGLEHMCQLPYLPWTISWGSHVNSRWSSRLYWRAQKKPNLLWICLIPGPELILHCCMLAAAPFTKLLGKATMLWAWVRDQLIHWSDVFGSGVRHSWQNNPNPDVSKIRVHLQESINLTIITMGPL